MFLVEDNFQGMTNLVFTWEDPRKAGYTGDVVEGVDLEYDEMETHSWPEGHAAPEPCVGRDPRNPKNYKVFKYSGELESAGYRRVPGNVAAFGSWTDYLWARGPDRLDDEKWYGRLDKLDEAARRRRQRTQVLDAPTDRSRDQVAAWVAKKHLLTDSGVREVWYLPRGAPPEEIRLLEVNDRLAGAESEVEAIDFGLDIEGANFRLFVADATSDQLNEIKQVPARLPPGWSLDDSTIWRRGA